MDYQTYLQGTKQILEQNRKAGRHTAIVCGKKFTVGKNVFSPKYFKDTEIFAKMLPITAGEHFLEIGPGCGAISIIAAYKGAKHIVSIDRNLAAVKCTRNNARRHGFKYVIDARHGSLFSALRPGELFNTIFWNTPFGLVDVNYLPDLDCAVFDPGYHSTKQFIQQGPRHLRPGGRLVIGFSSTLGRLDLLEKFCDDVKLKLKLLHRELSEETYSVYFELFEARK